MNFFKKMAVYTAILSSLTSIGGLQALQNNLPLPNPTAPPVPVNGVAASSFDVTLTVTPVNLLTVSNDIAFPSIAEGVTPALLSSTTTVTSLVSGSDVPGVGQHVSITGFSLTGADANGVASFLLHDPAGDTIAYNIQVTPAPNGTPGTATIFPGSNIIDIATAVANTATCTLQAILVPGQTVTAGDYTSTILVVSYLGL